MTEMIAAAVALILLAGTTLLLVIDARDTNRMNRRFQALPPEEQERIRETQRLSDDDDMPWW